MKDEGVKCFSMIDALNGHDVMRDEVAGALDSEVAELFGVELRLKCLVKQTEAPRFVFAVPLLARSLAVTLWLEALPMTKVVPSGRASTGKLRRSQAEAACDKALFPEATFFVCVGKEMDEAVPSSDLVILPSLRRWGNCAAAVQRSVLAVAERLGLGEYPFHLTAYYGVGQTPRRALVARVKATRLLLYPGPEPRGLGKECESKGAALYCVTSEKKPDFLQRLSYQGFQLYKISGGLCVWARVLERPGWKEILEPLPAIYLEDEPSAGPEDLRALLMNYAARVSTSHIALKGTSKINVLVSRRRALRLQGDVAELEVESSSEVEALKLAAGFLEIGEIVVRAHKDMPASLSFKRNFGLSLKRRGETLVGHEVSKRRLVYDASARLPPCPFDLLFHNLRLAGYGDAELMAHAVRFLAHIARSAGYPWLAPNAAERRVEILAPRGRVTPLPGLTGSSLGEIMVLEALVASGFDASDFVERILNGAQYVLNVYFHWRLAVFGCATLSPPFHVKSADEAERLALRVAADPPKRLEDWALYAP